LDVVQRFPQTPPRDTTTDKTTGTNASASTGITPFYADTGRHPTIAPQTFNDSRVPAAEEMAKKIKEIGEELKAM
ncbi:hypothetical protein FRB98_003201, partial [Tulasnella sp. 332]